MWILVLWGKREREKHLGYAADFCHLCRKIRAFAIKRVRLAGHIYFIPVERGTFLEHRQTCITCQTTRECHPGTYVHLSSSLEDSVERLIEKTYPSVGELYKDRIEFENQVMAGASPLHAKMRMETLMDAFCLASAHFEKGSGLEGRRLLAHALKPLNPTEEEVRECLQHFRRNGARMGARLRTAEVLKSISQEDSRAKPDAYDY